MDALQAASPALAVSATRLTRSACLAAYFHELIFTLIRRRHHQCFLLCVFRKGFP
jgi:hypothetical protein